MWTRPEIPANTHAPAGTPPVATSNTALTAPAIMNCPHKARNGSPLRLARVTSRSERGGRGEEIRSAKS